MQKLRQKTKKMNKFESEKHKKQRTKDIELDENVSFEDLNLSKPILDGLKSAAFYKPSPVQLKAIPLGKIGLGNTFFLKIKSNKRTESKQF